VCTFFAERNRWEYIAAGTGGFLQPDKDRIPPQIRHASATLISKPRPMWQHNKAPSEKVKVLPRYVESRPMDVQNLMCKRDLFLYFASGKHSKCQLENL
jgi:hypothetical protein